MYIVIFNFSSQDRQLMTDNWGQSEFFDDYHDACYCAESWIDGHDFRSYRVFEEVMFN